MAAENPGLELDDVPPRSPSEVIEEDEFRTYIHSITKGRVTSTTILQLLTPFIDDAESNWAEFVNQELAKTSSRRNKVTNLDQDGYIISESLSKSAAKLWRILRTSKADTGNPFGQVTQLRALNPLFILVILEHSRDLFNGSYILSQLTSRIPNASLTHYIGVMRDGGESLAFSIKYFYVHGIEQAIYTGQELVKFHEKAPHLHMYRGSSTVSLYHDTNDDSRMEHNREWRLLIVSCNEHGLDQIPNLESGLEAYLWAIRNEFRKAKSCIRVVVERIAAVSVPAHDFLFKPELRDSLLFEDESYTNSKTTFWALQSLRIMNETIKSMTAAWEDYSSTSLQPLLEGDPFTRAADEPLSGLGVGLVVAQSHRQRLRDRLAEIDEQVRQLAHISESIGQTQEEIRALRDGLFSASAVAEARASLMQGNNVRVLTIISMVFLPASFATSVFGMQFLTFQSSSGTGDQTGDGPAPSSAFQKGMTAFAITIGVVCGLTYTAILAAFLFPGLGGCMIRGVEREGPGLRRSLRGKGDKLA